MSSYYDGDDIAPDAYIYASESLYWADVSKRSARWTMRLAGLSIVLALTAIVLRLLA